MNYNQLFKKRRWKVTPLFVKKKMFTLQVTKLSFVVVLVVSICCCTWRPEYVFANVIQIQITQI